MKFVMLILTCFAILTVSCTSTPSDGKPDTARYESAARLAAYTGTAMWLTDHPGDREKFVIVRNSIQTLLLGDTVDPSQLQSALGSLPVSELRSGKSAILIGAATLMFEEIQGGSSVEVVKNEQVKAFAVGIRDGIDFALNIIPN